MLQAIQLSKHYGDKKALNRLDLEIGAGEIFCLLGPNGAGKTTTVKLFLGFLDASEGQALVNGQPVQAKGKGPQNRLAYIPENLMLYAQLTGFENLRFFSRLAGHRLTKSELEQYLIEAGLQSNYLHQKASAYSKGMRQKVGIAIAMAQKATALVLDEPTSGLDPKAAYEFSEALRRLRATGSSVLMTTHDLFRAKDVADRIGIMREGSLQTIFDPRVMSHEALEQKYLEVITYA